MMQNFNDIPKKTSHLLSSEHLFDGAPIPLIQRCPVPPFPVESLPEPIAAMVTGLAETTQTDPAMASTSALSVLAACCGGRRH